MSEIKKTKRRSPSPPPPRDQAKAVSTSIRERVLNAAFSLFREHGFSSTSMLDIVTRAPNIETRPLRPIQEQARRTSRRKSRP